MTDKKCASKNKHIKSYLDFYLNNNFLGYAVLINGEWGVGKTHFVEEYLRTSGLVRASFTNISYFAKVKKWLLPKNKVGTNVGCEKKKYVYVSLYGLSSPSDINDAIASQILFSGKRGMFKVFDGFLKYLKWRFVFFSRFELTDFSVLSKDVCLYVFDDLERYSGDLHSALGCLNYLVEHKSARLLILANEEEIESKVDRYVEIKEKLIGKKLDLEPDFTAAFESYLSRLNDHASVMFLRTHVYTLEAMFFSANKKNLRAFRQVFMEFKSFYEALDKNDCADDDEAISQFMVYFVMAYEYQIGFLRGEDILCRKSSLELHIKSRQEGFVEDSFDKVERRHSGIDLRGELFSNDFWYELIVKGWINLESVEEALKLPAFNDNVGVEEEWKVLWAWDSYAESDFRKAFDIFEKKMSVLGYDDFAVLIHLFGVNLALIESEIVEGDDDAVLGYFKNYADSFFKSLDAYEYFDDNKIIAFYGSHLSAVYQESAYGLGFKKLADARLKQWIDYLSESVQKSIISTFEKRAECLLNILRKDVNDFYRQLNGSGEYATANYKIPIISYLNIDKLCRILLDLKNDQMAMALGALVARFRTRSEEFQKLEIDAMREIREKLVVHAQSEGEYKRKVVVEKLRQRFDINLDG